MKYVITGILFVMLLCVGNSHSAEATDAPLLAKEKSQILTTTNGVRFGIWGTKVPYSAPTLFIFSATIEESLDNPYYRQCGTALAEQGFLCVSLDLPGHGKDRREGEPGSLATWRHRSDRGEDFVTPFTKQVQDVLDYLIQEGYTDPDRVAACGTSRGGFMALHAAAADPRIRATAVFAPVTALMTLREFHGTEKQEHAESLSLYTHAENLTGQSLWIIIGDRDVRVGTDDVITFARRVTTLSLEESKTSDVTLIIQPEPKGHTTPAGSPALATAWIHKKIMNPPPIPGEK